MAGPIVRRRRKQAPLREKVASVRRTKKSRTNALSGAVVVLSGSTALHRQKAVEVVAQELKRDLFRVELSTVVSQYIGETEKNLNAIFDMAERKGTILVFDEADALFGKRSKVKDAHDRYADAEVAHLLQRIESHQGLVILATNGKSRIDRTFSPQKPVVVLVPAKKKKHKKKE